MTTRIRLAFVIGVIGAAAGTFSLGSARSPLHSGFVVHAADSCGALSALTIPQVRISAATPVAAGRFTPAPGAASFDAPAFCRVVAVGTPTAESIVNFEVWLPAADAWNRKFQAAGNSGWSGAIPYDGMVRALRRGYATAGTDTGHTGDDPSFAAGHPERITDWAYRAVRVMTAASQLVIRAGLGAFPTHAYFVGCGTGGGQGLMAAQRFPDDYDGIVACNPGNDRIDRFASYLWGWNAAHETPESAVSAAKLAAVNDAVIAACDERDGLKDGIIDDPRRCTFDPGTLLCRGAEDATCLSSRQLETIRKIYNGPHSARLLRLVYPGVPQGSERDAGWRQLMDGAEPPDVGFWKHFVFDDPNWDFRSFDWDNDLLYAHSRLGSVVDATAFDLGPFKARGGKIIMTANWNDALNVAEQAIDYYEGVERTVGKDEKTRDFFRLFLVPGVGQNQTGPGPGTFDALEALELWAEHEVAPEKIVASKEAAAGAPARSRPLCPYPQVARQKDGGSPDAAASFTCVSPPRK